MHDESVTQHDEQAGAQPTAEFATDGLFSHPDLDHATTNPGSSSAENQPSYTDLFREPADGPENSTSAA